MKYGDVAPEAKENFIPILSESEFETSEQLRKYNLNFPNYANPCELYSVVLDGEALPLPPISSDVNVGVWSEQISDDYGNFAKPIILTLESDNLYSSKGLTLTFDNNNEIYPTSLNIKWFFVSGDSEEQLQSVDFAPNQSVYFCQKEVSGYNKIVITLFSLNMPRNRLKIKSIDYGYGTFFYGDELRSVKVIQELNPISSEISINTVDFTLDGKGDMVYSFQEKQPISVYFNGELKATTFVKKSKRKSKYLWEIQSEDYIGILDDIPYQGGIYQDYLAINILDEIFDKAKIPYEIDDSFSSSKVTGYIPYTNCREALMQVAFAINSVVDTSNSDVVKIFSLKEEPSQTIGLDRIMQGQNFDEEDEITGVEVASHSYKPTDEYVVLYDASESGAGNDILVKFNEPIHDLNIENGEILKSGTNFAVISGLNNCVLRGKKYEHTTSVKYISRNSNKPQKIASVENATLVSSQNIDIVLEKCYNYFTKRKSTNMRVVEGKHISGGDIFKYSQAMYGNIMYGEKTPKKITYDMPVNVGDTINAETEYLGEIIGIVTKQTFNLNGGVVVKDCVLK